jgi:two-component system, OmpR family, sensor histidine kinase CssS
MARRLKDLPLTIKFWILISCFVTACIITVSLFFYYELIHTSDATAFASIKKSQTLGRLGQSFEENRQSDAIPSEYDAIVSVYHIGIRQGKMRFTTFPASRFGKLSTGFIKSMLFTFQMQKTGVKKYKLSSNNYNLYFVVSKNHKDGGTVTFTVNDADTALYVKAARILFFFAFLSIILALVVAYLFARHFAKPLQQLEQAAMRTASGDFDTPVQLDRKDEIGKLSAAIDKARVALKKKDFLRQNAIQYVSHELKTPIMTILSYTQLIHDELYTPGNLNGALEVIDEQAGRMQEIVMKLLTLTRLDFLDSKKQETQRFDLAGICEDTACRLCASHSELELALELEDVVMTGFEDQITVLAENLIENAIRYAQTRVVVRSGLCVGQPFLSVFNDGEAIDENQLSSLFEPYQKGKNGITGLGLSIVSRIAKNCDAAIEVENCDGGVRFTVIFMPIE